MVPPDNIEFIVVVVQLRKVSEDLELKLVSVRHRNNVTLCFAAPRELLTWGARPNRSEDSSRITKTRINDGK